MNKDLPPTKKDEDDLNKYSWTISSAVSFAGLFTTLSLFFTGLIITNYDNFESYVRIPVLFLIICTFGFLYATLIYINTTYKLSIFTLEKCKKGINLGDIISEYMGVYFLIFAVPLVIIVITQDQFLRWSVLGIDILGLLIYHISGLSVMNAFFGRLHYLLMTPLIVLELLIFMTLDSSKYLSTIITIFLILYISVLALMSIRLVNRELS